MQDKYIIDKIIKPIAPTVIVCMACEVLMASLSRLIPNRHNPVGIKAQLKCKDHTKCVRSVTQKRQRITRIKCKVAAIKNRSALIMLGSSINPLLKIITNNKEPNALFSNHISSFTFWVPVPFAVNMGMTRPPIMVMIMAISRTASLLAGKIIPTLPAQTE